MRNILLAMIMLATLLSGCALEKNESLTFVIHGDLQAWVDAPLEGTFLALPVSYTLVCHGSDPSGVQALEFSVDDQVIATQANPSPQDALFNSSVLWETKNPGAYIIRCRVQNADGEWSGYASARVTILEEKVITPTFTSTPTLTPTPTPTNTPSPTPTSTITPTVVLPTFGTPTLSGNVLEYKFDCIPDPSQVSISVSLVNSSQPTSVLLFYRLKVLSTGATTAWNEGLLMNPQGGNLYGTVLTWQMMPAVTDLHGDSAEIHYQFVASSATGEVLFRSPVYTDIMLSRCY